MGKLPFGKGLLGGPITSSAAAAEKEMGLNQLSVWGKVVTKEATPDEVDSKHSEVPISTV